MTRRLPLLSVLLALAACSDSKTSSTLVETPSKHLLAADVPGTLQVLDALKKEPDAEVAVVGRVRDLARGGFRLVDDKHDYCGRGPNTMDGCPTPWDYCCLDQEEIAASTLYVKALAADGTPVAKGDMGIRHLDLVAVKGKLVKEADGSLALVAKEGWFRRERPVLPDNVKFP